MQLIRLYVDTPKTGCGFRQFLVLGTGHRWARLISTETADAIRVPIGDLKYAKPMQLKPKRAARRLREVARTYGVETEAVKEALAMLRAA